jgi:aminoglycoside/choline kinase family phosphotransferase
MVDWRMENSDLSSALAEDCLLWLREKLDEPIEKVSPLTPEASARRYFRIVLKDQRHYVFVDSGAEPKALRDFVMRQAQLQSVGWPVPVLLAQDGQRAWALQQDLGDACLQQCWDSAHWMAALHDLLKLQRTVVSSWQLPVFDMAAYQQRIVDAWPRWQTDPAWHAWLKSIAERLNAQPKRPCHRDFHSRNIMVLPGDQLVHIDFQMLCLGPLAYDVASLLYDAYSVLTPQQRAAAMQSYVDGLCAAQLWQPSRHAWAAAVRDAALWRHLRCLPLFQRLANKQPQYAKAYQVSHNYLQQLSQEGDCFPPLAQWLARQEVV